MKTTSLIPTITRKELQEIIRDGRLRALGVIVVILALTALAFGVQQTDHAQKERSEAATRSVKQWEGQGKRNPHVAAHYGTHVFAPTSAATAIDPGVSAYLGRSVRVEAHRRNLASHSAAEDSASLQRLGDFSVATVLLLLIPLLIIALGYGLWSRERERGTLRQLLSTNVRRRDLFWGKAFALGTVIAALLIPAGLIIVGALWTLGGGDGDTLLRLGVLTVSYGVYYGIFAGLTLYASAASRSSRTALAALVGLWGLVCLIAPRIASEAAGALRPLPSQAELGRAIGASLENGLDGESPREDAIDEILRKLKADKGIADTGMMVDDTFLTGFELQAESRYEDGIFNHHVDRLNAQIQSQEYAVSWAGFLSPFIAMRALSAGLCGTDYAHHRHFTDYAEGWRQALVDRLNQTFAEKAGAEGWNYRAGKELWKAGEPFAYAAPGLAFAIDHHLVDLAALGVWFLLALWLAVRSAASVKVV
jgi:ABC-2 type transport system permease protein